MELLKNSKGKLCAIFGVFLLIFMFSTPISSTSEAGADELLREHDPLFQG